MNISSYRRNSPFSINRYSHNAVLQLIIATGIAYCMFQAVRVTMIVFGQPAAAAQNMVLPFVALPPIQDFLQHFWTVFTYGWFHNGFMEWVSNAIWIFVFGNVVQNLVGYKQVIPTFFYATIVGGLFCVGIQFIPGIPAIPPAMTAVGGIMALAAASLTVAPKFRYYLGENFSIPLVVVVGIFVVLTLVSFSSKLPMLAMCGGGALTGWAMMKLVQKGFHPGGWMYAISGALNGSMIPQAERNKNHRSGSQQKTYPISRKETAKDDRLTVDEILDKINQRGYNSLTAREREILVKASKETQG